MKKQTLDKVGFLTSKVYDMETNTFAKQGTFLSVRKIDCYYNENDGIYGFFPTYENQHYDEQINSKPESFYREFNKEYLEKLKNREITHGIKLTHFTYTLKKGEYLKSFVVCYDEDKKKMTAIKFRTNMETHSVGKKSELNKRAVTSISKEGYFIPGFKTAYLLDKDIHYLSYIQVYYENEDHLQNYFKVKEPNRLKLFLKKKINSAVNFSIVLSRFLLISFIILFPFAFYYYKSQNIYGGEIIIPESVQGLTESVKVHTDSSGFIHIKAESNKDAYFALGFAHAKDRLWQMDFMRRTSRGKLSEIFGLKTLPIDKVMRSLGLNEMCERFERHVRHNSKHLNMLISYVNGINYFANNFFLPPEYHIFRAEWSNWKIADTIAVSNLMALTLTHDWNMEVWYKIIEENLGKDFAELVISYRDLNYPFFNETIVNDDELVNLGMHRYRKKTEEILRKEREIREKEAQRSEENIKDIETQPQPIEMNTDTEVKEETEKVSEEEASEDQNSTNKDSIINPLQSQGASNSWVISGNYTSSGAPLLSNDPHLTNSMPSLFYVTKFYLPDNTIVGGTVPGIPFIMTGSNKYMSWGFTTENSDTADICEEKIEEDFYIFDGKKTPLSKTRETIAIKGKAPEIFDLKWTRNGPLIAKNFPKELLVVNFDYKSDIPLSVRLALYTTEFTSPDFLMAVNHAKSSADFLSLADLHVGPNLNLVYASKDGEIGWLPIGRFPVKKYKNRFCRGYSSEDEIIKFIQRVELPRLSNPDKGFIVTANNKPASFNYTYELYGFHNHVRAFRIRQLIEERISNSTKFTVTDSIDIMKDLKDSLAEIMLPQILTIVERNLGRGNAQKLKYFEDLKKWDFTLVKDSPLPTIWSTLELHIGKQLLTNKVSEQKARGIMTMLHYWNFISAIIEKIHNGERVDLKQCAHLSGNINCEKYIVYIFNNLDKFLSELKLKDKYGRVYNWGEVKFNNYPHGPMHVIPVLGRLFSKEVYTGGNRNTVKVARGPFNHDQGNFVSTHSPRLKFVCDMSEPTRPYLVIDGGNSGNILSKFYNNLMLKNEETELIQIEDIDFDQLRIPSANTLLLRNH